MITDKGKPKNLKAGFTFFISMIVVSLSALVVSIIKDIDFLFYLGIFSFYMNYTGFRSIKNKRLILSELDWIITIIAAINTFFMLYQMQLVLAIFGIISFFLVFGQISTYIRLKSNKEVPQISLVGATHRYDGRHLYFYPYCISGG